MLRKICFSFVGLSFAGAYYLQKEKVDLKNQYLRTIVEILHKQNPKYSNFLLANMIRFSMIKQSNSLKDFVFSEGFDYDGKCLEGLMEIGFNTVQVGPVSLLSSCSQESRSHFGSKISLANVNTFNQTKVANRKYSKIGVCIAPNYQILKYTPYLIAQNILQCMKQFEILNEQNQSADRPSIDRYIIKLNQQQMKQLELPQYLAMIGELIKNAHDLVKQTLLRKQSIILNSPQQQKEKENNKAAIISQAISSKNQEKIPKIFVEIPNQNSNSKLFHLVKSIPELQYLIVDNLEYQIKRENLEIANKKKNNKNNKYSKQAESKKSISLKLGKNRITFEQLVQKIIDSSV